MKSRAALLAGLLVLSGCGTLSLGGSKPAVEAGKADPAKPDPARQKVASAIIAAMAGGLIGGEIGKSLDATERRRGLEAEYRALEYTQSGQTVTWKMDGTSTYGEVVAAQPYRVGSQDCRQYSHTLYTGAQPRTARGTACRNPDGSWTPLT